MLQKTITVDFLTHKRVKNEGQVPQFFVENSHPAIIFKETFQAVQREMERRSQLREIKTVVGIPTGILSPGKSFAVHAARPLPEHPGVQGNTRSRFGCAGLGMRTARKAAACRRWMRINCRRRLYGL